MMAAARAGDGVAEVDGGVWLVSDPAATERLLASEDALTARAELRTAVTSWGPDGLDRWMAARAAMRPALAASEVTRFVPTMVALTEQVLTGWPRPGLVDGMREAVLMASAINTSFVLGAPSETVSSLVADELDLAGTWYRRRRLLRAQRRTYAAIADHVRFGDGTLGLLDVLTGSTGFDERAVVLAARAMLLSGHRVPAAALAWTLHELAEHPQAQDLARREATAYRPDQPTAGLRYCRAVVRETLRLHPPVWRFQRQLAAPATVGVHELPAGAAVGFSSYVNQRDPGVYADPDEFRPLRWCTTDRQPAPGSYFPFGLGRRFCPGSALALTELTVVLATVLRSYALSPDRSPAPSHGALHAPDGLRLRVTALDG